MRPPSEGQAYCLLRLSSLPLRAVVINRTRGVLMVRRNTRQTGTKAAKAAGKVLANP